MSYPTYPMPVRCLVSAFLGLSLSALTSACHRSSADEAEPVAAVQGTWSIDESTIRYSGRNRQVVSQADTPPRGDHAVISDSTLLYLLGNTRTVWMPAFPCKRDGDSLRMRPTSYDVQVYAIKELTAHKMTLMTRRRTLSLVIPFSTGDAYYDVLEQHYSR
jgi:hypothetical protein